MKLLDQAEWRSCSKNRGLGTADLRRAVEAIGEKAESFGDVGRTGELWSP